jgi:dephospho-CoA kinase
MLKVGLTGGIGSGKSTVAQCLVQHGAGLLDADAIARQLTIPGGLAMPLIAKAFGSAFMTASGALDRDKMRALAYTDVAARQQLESIIHPLVGQETQRQATLAAAQGCDCIVFDIPLLVESTSWRTKLDLILVVDCTPETQISRVLARDPLKREAIEQIMATQASRVQRLSAADAVIFNDALSRSDLATEVRQIAPRFGLSSGLHLATQTISA